MKKSFVLIAAIVAVVGLGTAVAVAEDTIKVKTSLKLKFSSPDSYSGTVKARKGCQEGRKVTLTHGVNKLGSDNSNNRGKYKIIGPTSTGDGLRAVARETKITQHDGDKIVCERGRSKKVKNRRQRRTVLGEGNDQGRDLSESQVQGRRPKRPVRRRLVLGPCDGEKGLSDGAQGRSI